MEHQKNKNFIWHDQKIFWKIWRILFKNIQIKNRQKNPKSSKTLSLNNPKNLEDCLNSDVNKIKRKASKIVTLLFDNVLNPVPKKDLKDSGIAEKYDKKELKDAQRTVVFIRKLQYARQEYCFNTGMVENYV